MPAAPTFIIIGAQKAGSTWLSDMVRQHPSVSMPDRKELHFFDVARDHLGQFRGYLDRFSATPQTIAVGEATPNYVWVPDALPPEVPMLCDVRTFGAQAYPELNPDPAQTIAALLPDVQLVLLLRDPVDRAISSFRHHIRMRRIPPAASIVGPGGQSTPILDAHGIVAQGFYAANLMRWFQHFEPDQLLVLSLEDDVLAEPRQALRRVFTHLGVDPDFEPAGIDERTNTSASDPFLWSHYYAPRLSRRVFRRMPRLHGLSRPRIAVSAHEKRMLRELYAPEVKRLSDLLGRSFHSWPTAGDRPAVNEVGGEAQVTGHHR